jgi:hypothetical protein
MPGPDIQNETAAFQNERKSLSESLVSGGFALARRLP